MDEYQARIIIAYARSSMNRSEVAREFRVTPATINYWFNQVESVTGLNPRNFFDLGELYQIASTILDDEKE